MKFKSESRIHIYSIETIRYADNFIVGVGVGSKPSPTPARYPEAFNSR